MATLVNLPFSFYFGVHPKKAQLPSGWTYREKAGDFLKAIAPDGAEYFWNGENHIRLCVNGQACGEAFEIPR